MSPLAIAVGGTQSIRALEGAGAGAPPFMLAFIAAASAPVILVVSTTPPDVVVEGKSAGQAYLRLLDPGTNLLFDRVLLDVKPIDPVDLRPIASRSISSA